MVFLCVGTYSPKRLTYLGSYHSSLAGLSAIPKAWVCPDPLATLRGPPADPPATLERPSVDPPATLRGPSAAGAPAYGVPTDFQGL